MAVRHKNKTLATLLAFLFGGLGAHRFYLNGGTDRIGLLHLCSVPLVGVLNAANLHPFYPVLPFLVSYIVGFVEALVIGLTPDEKWDARWNKGSGRTSNSKWYLALLLVLTMLVGTTVMIGTISRLFDVMYTGGAYG